MTRARRSVPGLTAAIALVALGLSLSWPEGPRRLPARPTAVLMSGRFAQWNSRSGSAVFRASGMTPGGIASGTVTIKNTGDLAGAFRVSQTGLTDSTGLGGGQLSARLSVLVEDVTDPAHPLTTYSGPLTGLATRPLGRFQPGDSHTYRFSAIMADGGVPGSATSGDNAYQRSSISVRYGWSATEVPSPAGGSSPPPPAEGGAPPVRPTGPAQTRIRVSVFAPRRQSGLRRRVLLLLARCDRPCRLSVTGRLRTPGLRAGRSFAIRSRGRIRRANRRTTLRFRLSRRGLRLLRRAFARRKPLRLALSIRVADETGRKVTLKRRVNVRPPPRRRKGRRGR